MTNSANGQYVFFSSQSKNAPEILNGVDVAFVGECVDERGEASIEALKNVPKVLTLRFDASSHDLYLNSEITRRSRISNQFKTGDRILLDATTLGLGEILQVLMAALQARLDSIEFLYAEPGEYDRKISEDRATGYSRDYVLTTNRKFSSVQGFAHEYERGKRAVHAFLLGFEPGRIRSAAEERDFEQNNYDCYAIIGVPAFRPGWEGNSVRPHLHAFDDFGFNEGSIIYCQASSIRESYLSLWDIYSRLKDERCCFFVSPLGTKPHAVGAALFLLETKGSEYPTSLYYDHPVRVPKRSRQVSKWHHIKVKFGD